MTYYSEPRTKKNKVVHYGEGGASRCRGAIRAYDTLTIHPEAVNCPRCRALLMEREDWEAEHGADM